MKYLKEFISEAFDRKVPYSIIKDTFNEFITSAIIGNREIKFIAKLNGDDGSWDLSFIEIDKDGDATYQKTNSGNELEVFSMVKHSIDDFIKEVKPDIIKFQSDNTNRVSLYRRMLKRYAADYNITETGGTFYKTFTLTRK